VTILSSVICCPSGPSHRALISVPTGVLAVHIETYTVSFLPNVEAASPGLSSVFTALATVILSTRAPAAGALAAGCSAGGIETVSVFF
jgi:hypothetical protein